MKFLENGSRPQPPTSHHTCDSFICQQWTICEKWLIRVNSESLFKYKWITRVIAAARPVIWVRETRRTCIYICVLWLIYLCICVVWLIYTCLRIYRTCSVYISVLSIICGMSSNVDHDSFLCVARHYAWAWHYTCVRHASFVCERTHSNMGHDSFICGTWLIHIWDMIHS